MLKRKIIHYIILLCAMITLDFFFPRLMPGSPVSRIVGEDTGDLTVEQRAQIVEFYELDKPITEQFAGFIKNTVTLNWGTSYSKKQPVFDLLKNALPWTLLLAGCNLVLSTLVGTFIGSLSAFLRKKRKDIGIVLGLMLVGTLPSFWIGMVMISVFSVRLGWFPLYGAYSLWGNNTGIAYFLDVIRHLALPVTTMLIVSITIFFTTSRYSVLNTMEQNYVDMARIRGIQSKKIKSHYIIRNSLIPVFTVFMMELGFVLGGSIVIERLFSYPGIGLLLYDAISARDYPLMQYTFLITSVMVIITTFLADILAKKIDPSMEISYEE